MRLGILSWLLIIGWGIALLQAVGEASKGHWDPAVLLGIPALVVLSIFAAAVRAQPRRGKGRIGDVWLSALLLLASLLYAVLTISNQARHNAGLRHSLFQLEVCAIIVALPICFYLLFHAIGYGMDLFYMTPRHHIRRLQGKHWWGD